MSLNTNPNKSLKSIENDNESDLELINKLSKMTNDEIGNMLDNYIDNDKTNEFISCLNTIKLLQFKLKEEEKEMKTNDKNRISLNYILNEGMYGNPQAWPLIVLAAYKNNIEIVETLVSNENDYQVMSFLFCLCFCFCFCLVKIYLTVI